MTLIYKGNYINRSRQQLLDSLSQRLKPTRFEHVLRVEATALAIAKPLEVEPEKISVAALMHDYAKDMDPEEMYQLAYAYSPHETLEQADTAVWHGFAAAYICREEFHCGNTQVQSLHNLRRAYATGIIRNIIFLTYICNSNR